MDAPDVKPLVVHRCHAAAYSIFMLVSSLKLQLTQCLPMLTGGARFGPHGYEHMSRSSMKDKPSTKLI